MASVHGSVEIQVETCKGCELCVEACPQDNCTGCTNCALVCPDAVITVYRESKGKTASASKRKEPVAVISNVKSNVKVVLDDVPKGKVSI